MMRLPCMPVPIGPCLTAMYALPPRLPRAVDQHCSLGNMLLTVHVEDRDGTCMGGEEPPAPSAPLPEPGTVQMVGAGTAQYVRQVGRVLLSLALTGEHTAL